MFASIRSSALRHHAVKSQKIYFFDICKQTMSYSQLRRALSQLARLPMRLNSSFTGVAALPSALRLALGFPKQ